MSTMTISRLIIFQGEMPGTLCAVPEEMVNEAGAIDRVKYVNSGWASKNCGLNAGAIGSHLFPYGQDHVEGPEAERYRDLAIR
jgi:hypothetical protein